MKLALKNKLHAPDRSCARCFGYNKKKLEIGTSPSGTSCVCRGQKRKARFQGRCRCHNAGWRIPRALPASVDFFIHLLMSSPVIHRASCQSQSRVRVESESPHAGVLVTLVARYKHWESYRDEVHIATQIRSCTTSMPND